MMALTAPFFSSPRCMSRDDCISLYSALCSKLITCNTGVARPAGAADYGVRRARVRGQRVGPVLGQAGNVELCSRGGRRVWARKL